MANQAAKKTKQKNQEILNNTRNIILAVLAIYLLYRVFYHFGSFAFLNWIGFFVLLGLLFFCFSGITSLAKCSYNSTGELVDGGADLSGSGLVEYYFDVLYLTLFVLFSSMFSEWFWLTFLLIPAYGGYKLIPMWLNSRAAAEGPESEKDRKKREKAERRAASPKFVRGR
eukprot:TRINITY_DN1140_c0_g1_i1.p1 TRINITY_DN1140_c0_g1~~TRINITY_DN1140_c0_g1_i1.p1  ORF type:complete len:170 (-),score=48.31 TRINITY_DN1140_c0_g1_i1:219-728(-)